MFARPVVVSLLSSLFLLLLPASAAFAGLKEAALAYRKGDLATSVKQIRPIADKGNPTAQYILGDILANAPAPLRDLAEAESWLKKSAEQGNLAAMTQLGMLHLYLKSPREPAQAVTWLRMAATRGHGDAQQMLGTFHMSGEGLEKDDTQAYMWLSLAAERGNLLAAVMMDVSPQFTAEVAEAGRRKAREWRPSW